MRPVSQGNRARPDVIPTDSPAIPTQMPAPTRAAAPVAENHRRMRELRLVSSCSSRTRPRFFEAARRSEYWWTSFCSTHRIAVIQALMPILKASVMSYYLPLTTGILRHVDIRRHLHDAALLGYSLLLFPCLITVRRLHDVNHSGWWVMAPTLCGIASRSHDDSRTCIRRRK